MTSKNFALLILANAVLNNFLGIFNIGEVVGSTIFHGELCSDFSH